MLSFKKIAVFVAVFVAALNVNGDIIAWSGDACNGAEGANVACNGGCISFDGRHSFEARIKEWMTRPYTDSSISRLSLDAMNVLSCSKGTVAPARPSTLALKSPGNASMSTLVPLSDLSFALLVKCPNVGLVNKLSDDVSYGWSFFADMVEQYPHRLCRIEALGIRSLFFRLSWLPPADMTENNTKMDHRERMRDGEELQDCSLRDGESKGLWEPKVM
ncbi:hypothetical protein C8J56DRAFT_883484 [Mycena floridula]|nr:hypothetical protein C8J56DRAFT_883484 [Mycena floridula]